MARDRALSQSWKFAAAWLFASASARFCSMFVLHLLLDFIGNWFLCECIQHIAMTPRPRNIMTPSTIAKFTLVPHLRRWTKGRPSFSSNPIPESCLQPI